LFDTIFYYSSESVRLFCPMYWILKTHGNIALEFKDFYEAGRIFKKLKNFCETRKQYKQKMHVYS